MAKVGIKPNNLLIVLGGSATLDLGGFVASTYQTGIDCVYLPTTLRAMIDTPTTGRVRINLPEGANLVGNLLQPRFVAADLNTLASLAEEQWASGLTAIARAALVAGQKDWQWLAANLGKLRDHDLVTVQAAIVKAVTAQATLIANDEFGLSNNHLLDFGVSFAEALQALNNSIPYGIALAEGTRFASHLAVEAIGAPRAFVADLETLLSALGLPALSVEYTTDMSADLLFDCLQAKQNYGQGIQFVLVKSPGNLVYQAVDPDLVKIYLIYWEQARRAL
jgi:3-dehydroquinate synthetase